MCARTCFPHSEDETRRLVYDFQPHPARAALSLRAPALLGFCSGVWGLFGSSSPRLEGVLPDRVGRG